MVKMDMRQINFDYPVFTHAHMRLPKQHIFFCCVFSSSSQSDHLTSFVLIWKIYPDAYQPKPTVNKSRLITIFKTCALDGKK